MTVCELAALVLTPLPILRALLAPHVAAGISEVMEASLQAMPTLNDFTAECGTIFPMSGERRGKMPSDNKYLSTPRLPGP